jgi:hypothetical protein
VELKRNGSQASTRGPAEYFTGTVRVDPLFMSPGPARSIGAENWSGALLLGLIPRLARESRTYLCPVAEHRFPPPIWTSGDARGSHRTNRLRIRASVISISKQEIKSGSSGLRDVRSASAN